MLRCDNCGAPWRKVWHHCRYCKHDTPSQWREEEAPQPVKRLMKVQEMADAGIISKEDLFKILMPPFDL